MARLPVRAPSEGAILGLLKDKPLHGYEIAVRFQGNFGKIYKVKRSQTYAVLKKLEDTGLIRPEIISQGVKPPRKVYYLTDAGYREFNRWVDSPVRNVRDVRVELLLKLFFSMPIGSQRWNHLIMKQLEVFKLRLVKLEEQVGQVSNEFDSAVWLSKVFQIKAIISWLENLLERKGSA